jgi:hypothetical protein
MPWATRRGFWADYPGSNDTVTLSGSALDGASAAWRQVRAPHPDAIQGGPAPPKSIARGFRGGTRRASPVARRVRVTVLSLPPRRSGPAASARLRRPMLPSRARYALGLRDSVLSRLPLRSLPLRPGDSLTILLMASSMGFRGLVPPPPAIQGRVGDRRGAGWPWSVSCLPLYHPGQ